MPCITLSHHLSLPHHSLPLPLQTHAMTNVAWTKELRAWYAINAHKGLVFTNMNTLHGNVVMTGQHVSD